jgi:hypothetical protein
MCSLNFPLSKVNKPNALLVYTRQFRRSIVSVMLQMSQFRHKKGSFFKRFVKQNQLLISSFRQQLAGRKELRAFLVRRSNAEGVLDVD